VNRFLGNHLLSISLALVTIYWMLASVIPNPHVSRAASLMVTISATAMTGRYLRDVYRILFERLRSDAEGGENAHLAVYGAFLVSLGTMWWGIYRLIFAYYGSPVSWLGNSFSGFGPAVVACGFILLFYSPDSIGPGIMVRTWFWQVTALIIALMAAFLLCQSSIVPN